MSEITDAAIDVSCMTWKKRKKRKNKVGLKVKN
jgi:hypothetical protein